MPRNNLVEFKSKRLRSCQARVHTATAHDGTRNYLLESYDSNVIDARNLADGTWEITLLPRWNYSRTTAYHVRAFLEDYLHVRIPVGELRNALADARECAGYTFVDAQCVPDWHRRKRVTVCGGERAQSCARAFWWGVTWYNGYWGF